VSAIGAYRGRFAPTPSGPLHTGSLMTALGSYLDARANGGQWLVRIEDIDPPREVPGADGLILQSLRAHQLSWDGEVLYQSTRTNAYEDAVQRLLREGRAYYCPCSRQDLELAGGVHGPDCGGEEPPPGRPAAVRVRTSTAEIRVHDMLRGEVDFDLARLDSDFIIRRKDGLYAYQLAVVVDDAFQQVSDVIRGLDLLDSTPRQIWLQQLLGLPTPRYGHLPLLVNETGQKLSKQNLARAVDDRCARENLRRCLQFLGQETPPSDVGGHIRELLDWAVANWCRDRIPGGEHLPHAE
jgi:glutamyl-Q tRNA(Asp) synthetase